MSERALRLVLVGIMCVTLFLPNTGVPNWFDAYWSSMEILAVILYSPLNIVLGFASILCLLAMPILILLSILLGLADSSVRLRRFYRILLLVVFPLMWGWTFLRWTGGLGGVGLWANPIVVTIAALMEIAFMISERLKRSQSTSSTIK
jgi:hypothetical protein